MGLYNNCYNTTPRPIYILESKRSFDSKMH
jgi:hypothetical protein